MSKILSKNAKGYGYKYTDLAAVNEYIGSVGLDYYQEILSDEKGDYINTIILDKDGKELRKVRGVRIVEAPLSGKSNPAQEQGSAITYARRYSLLMAFGLATEDDDGASLINKRQASKPAIDIEDVKAKIKLASTIDEIYKIYIKLPANLKSEVEELAKQRKKELANV